MDEITIRQANPGELTDVARLRWSWILENEGVPVVTRDEFVAGFIEWAQTHRASHSCVVALHGETVIGMAWLAILPRVPSPRALHRASGDLQCVYIIPEQRGLGIGGRMIEVIRQLAEERGLERLTVHSSTKAISAYARAGFVSTPTLMQVELSNRP